ncbi:MAG: biopolymer transporter ExbD [Lentimicrobiaceae bacterium]|nr:biopolymer transporter ExbD [Lentimicrobiaceae bacterium]
MAEIIQEESSHKKSGKRRAKKHSTHIDMTPMVDLMCLLITFFMLTTAFSKAKVMEITMPEKSETNEPKTAPKISAERTLNILISGDKKIYWYNGMADPKKPPLPALNATDYSKDGIRKILLERNKDLFTKIYDLRQKRVEGKLLMADSTANGQIKELKRADKAGPIVLIKADDKAKYENIVDIIDEMAIATIASYAIVDISPTELEMIKNAPK